MGLGLGLGLGLRLHLRLHLRLGLCSSVAKSLNLHLCLHLPLGLGLGLGLREQDVCFSCVSHLDFHTFCLHCVFFVILVHFVLNLVDKFLSLSICADCKCCCLELCHVLSSSAAQVVHDAEHYCIL